MLTAVALFVLAAAALAGHCHVNRGFTVWESAIVGLLWPVVAFQWAVLLGETWARDARPHVADLVLVIGFFAIYAAAASVARP